jgi:DNA-binding NarL/FixJ family response regulator
MDTTPQPVVLTERQTRVLWLLSTGKTYDVISCQTGVAVSGIKSTVQRLLRNLNAANTAHAVRIGLLEGHIGPYEDCGSRAAYRRHISQDEPTCPACKRGNRERADMEARLRSQAQLAEPHIRLLRAMHAGRTNLQIRHAWNIDERTLTRLIAATYTLLGVAHLAPAVRREAALREAAQRGLLGTQPPGASSDGGTPVKLSDTQVRILAELAAGASVGEAAQHLGLLRNTCSTRLSEAYQRLGVAWMSKDVRRAEAIQRARALGLIPEPVTA